MKRFSSTLTPFMVAVAMLVVAIERAEAWAPLNSSRPVYTNFPVAFELNRAASDNLPFANAEPIVRQAMEDWSRPACTSLRVAYSGPADRRPSSGDRNHTIAWVENNWDMDSSVIGYTPVLFSGRTLIESDMQLNGVDYTWIAGAGRGNNVNTYSIIAHEGGHFYGLGHSSVRSAIMAPSYSGGIGTIGSDDQQGICALYPSSTASDCTTTGCPQGQTCTNRICTRPTGSGGTCSPCSGEENECGDGACLTYPDSNGYCAAACPSGTCTGQDTCASIQGTKFCIRVNGRTPDCSGGTATTCQNDQQCRPNVERCDLNVGRCIARSATDVPLGQACTNDEGCGESGFCISGRCTQACDWLNTRSCPANYYCTGRLTGLCGDGYCAAGAAGGSAIGADCSADTQCQSLFCSDGKCSQPCNPSGANTCPAGTICAAGTSAACGGCRLAASLGDLCTANESCASRLCIMVNQDSYCSRLCGTSMPCPTDFVCTESDGGSVCIATRNGLGLSCTANEQCRSGICATEGSRRFCTRFATPSEPCPIGFTAAAVQGSTEQVCRPSSGGRSGCGCRVGSRSGSMLSLLVLCGMVFGLLLRRRVS